MESSSLQWRRFPENSPSSLRSLHFTLVYDISRYKFDFPTECCYFQVRQKKQSTGGNIMKSKIMTMAANVIQYLTDRERHEWALITPGGFYEPARPKETKE